jgi:hypothetical protein
MPPSASPLAHKDIEATLDRALANGKGVRIFCGDQATATGLRQRVYTLRKLDRRSSLRVYTPDDPMYGKSAYDAVICTPRVDTNEEWWLYIEVASPERLAEVTEDLE